MSTPRIGVRVSFLKVVVARGLRLGGGERVAAGVGVGLSAGRVVDYGVAAFAAGLPRVGEVFAGAPGGQDRYVAPVDADFGVAPLAEEETPNAPSTQRRKTSQTSPSRSSRR
jgi:hypothetical protein